jgi:serine/threonine protein kinase/tetratricopeptide (TPR) repeat protein
VSERTKKLEEIFHAASELPTPEQQEKFLNRACLGEADLRREVEALLKAAPAGDELFQPLEQSGLRSGDVSIAPATERAGTVIGRYKLLEQIGEGGMGVVYMAEQEAPVRRRVALKIIKLGMDTKQVVARFEAERQALAMMEHPHIAKILDAGATDSGRPYFVMELVRGVPITRFCDENHLSPKERIQLFIPVCQAIQSAHQKGVIHRDIKPSNVLVTLNAGSPHPMVIDFGVAKATNQKLTEKTLFTHFATMIGTPAYMSPEQAEMSKLDVDTRSDIYSLGVLLYELLTGSVPFPEARLRSVAYGEMQRIIAEEEPERPSTRLKKRALTGSAFELGSRHSSLATDLDWIVMKCLEKDRNRRYDTANALGGDIQAHLNDEPVVARPPSMAYRFQKFVRRNRTGSIAVALVTVTVLLGVLGSTRGLIRERAARKESDHRLRAALGFVDDIFKDIVPELGDLTGAANIQEKLGQSGVKFLQRLQGSAADDPEMRLTLARLFLKTSGAQNPDNANSIGDFEAGLRQARQAVNLLATDSLEVSESERMELLCGAKFNIDMCLYALGRVDEAIGHLDELDSLYEKLEQFPKHARYARRIRQSIRNNAGYYTTLTGRPAEAIQRFLMPILKSDWARSIDTHSTNAAAYELETVMNANAYVASAYLFLKDFLAMRTYAEESLRIADLAVQRFPSSGKFARQRARSMVLSAYALTQAGETGRGTDGLDASREAIEALVSKDTLNDQFRYQRAVTAAIQAMAFAGLSKNLSLNTSARRNYLEKARTYLTEAEDFARAAKTLEPESYLRVARADIDAAKAKL